MKKLISFLLSLTVMLSVLTLNVGAVTVGDYSVSVIDGNAVITAYNGSSAEVSVPDTLNGFKVVGIGEEAFRGSAVKAVDLPDSLSYISESAFADCESLTAVSFGNSLESIGDTAFYNCKKLTSALRFPESLKKIGDSAFEGCWDMTYAVVPAGVEEVGYCAFGYYYEQDASDKRYYDFKRSDFKIFGYDNSAAKEYCESHKFDFYDLASGYDAVSYNGMDFFINTEKTAELTSYNDSSSDLKIPETVNGYTVKAIGDYAFFGSAVKSVTIPKTVEEIGKWAFESCDNLKKIKVPPTVKTVNEGALGYYYEDGFNYPYLDFKICGAPDSGAKEYADKYEFMFEDVYTTFVTLKSSSGAVYLKGSLTISANVKNPSGKTKYTSSDKSIAKVNSSGKVTGKKAGKTKITVENNGVKKTFTITVKKPKLNKTKAYAKIGKLYQLKITGQVGEAKFVSSNSGVVKVNSKTGKFKGLRKGSAVITVKTNGIKLKCKVRVK